MEHRINVFRVKLTIVIIVNMMIFAMNAWMDSLFTIINAFIVMYLNAICARTSIFVPSVKIMESLRSLLVTAYNVSNAIFNIAGAAPVTIHVANAHLAIKEYILHKAITSSA
jgi:hypothetical protein